MNTTCPIQNFYPMKDVYVNPALAPLLIRHRPRPRRRIFSGGKVWQLLTPSRLADAAGAVGIADPRILRLIALLRRHAPHPEAHCRRLGLPETRFVPPGGYVVALCPGCRQPHRPHPADAAVPCPVCREGSSQSRPPGGAERDRRLDEAARTRLRVKHPDDFHNGVLSPGWRYNTSRVLRRDWDAAAGRILMGLTYRQAVKEFDCSLGTLHKRVSEVMAWENN